jgi:pimeloyl-ACP methyl ester carboxylesterase
MLRAEVNGLSIAYEQIGRGPVLVLLHGFLVDSRQWRPQLEGLAEEFTLIAWDAPGAGRSSDPPESFATADWADCLAGLLEVAGVEAAHILGLSWGGILAQEFYRRHARCTRSLVLADTYAGWRGSLGEAISDERLANCLRDSSLPAGQVVAKYLPGMHSESAAEEVREGLASIISRFHPVGFRTMARSSAELDTRDLLAEIRVPTLLVWGEADARSPMSVAHRIQDAIPDARLAVIPGAGHVSNFEAPAQFNAAVRDFCLSVRTS